jgi:hypothetical protein
MSAFAGNIILAIDHAVYCYRGDLETRNPHSDPEILSKIPPVLPGPVFFNGLIVVNVINNHLRKKCV